MSVVIMRKQSPSIIVHCYAVAKWVCSGGPLLRYNNNKTLNLVKKWTIFSEDRPFDSKSLAEAHQQDKIRYMSNGFTCAQKMMHVCDQLHWNIRLKSGISPENVGQ